MPVPSRHPAVVQFGAEGMRCFHLSAASGVRLPEAVRADLEETGVPLQVAPYFTAAGESDALPLSVFAAQSSLPRPATELEGWLRVGHDGLAHLCVRPDGVLQAVMLEGGEKDLYVSSDHAAFNASLAVLDRILPVIATSSDLTEAAAAFWELNEALRGIDAEAFGEREGWWPRVLDDVRHTLNFPFSAAFEYVDGAGEKRIVTGATGPGRAHPEELVWRELSGQGVAPGQVRRVFCELQACMMPGHYCAVWLQRLFPRAEFTHAFDYGSDAASREAGLKGLIIRAAEQAGRG
ncbi:SUKH-4 family immunity protein [Streptomyces scopuliridis]|uniref:SUKH-4 family immunity protein n=1 Tax=Streptomyces scopuliridis TaxID=452529 RepID=A0ACD4ZTB3_9ACTN|nr:nucleic acid/nucleotide deaminase domain-containing protein [Streptomyces scopuliridis]WSC01531.1 SUKH-4 family immunity protein [Streptomyces scopuliridis]WSC04931.1 SUKH-4 family immunity protein [Streptomyces scopuliridis]